MKITIGKIKSPLFLLGAALVLLSLGGCGEKEEKKAPEGEPLVTALRFVEELKDGKFEGATEKFGEAMAREMPKERLEQTWSQLEGQVGGFVEIQSQREEILQGYDVVYVTTEFQQALIDIRVVFGEEGWIEGLFFLPAEDAFDDGEEVREEPDYIDQEAFREETVSFGEAPWILDGTLAIPQGEGPFPGVVLIHGSGPNDRDETVGPNKPFKDIAQGLASSGIAVLRYDKRTYTYGEELQDAEEAVTVREETMEDALQALEYLKTRGEISNQRLYLAGHSLGGMLLPRIASETRDLEGLIYLAAPARPLGELILMQMEYLAEQEGHSAVVEAQLEEAREQVRRIMDPDLSPDTDPDEIMGVSPGYWLDLQQYSPVETAKTLDIPMIFLQGERDYQVTMEDVEIWREALGDRDDTEFISYPELNHLFLFGEGPSIPEEYMEPDHVDQAVISDLIRWLEP
ncbi:alpha/beta hydrolase [Isachenkonia alkalipeptolytica]|uniref:Alpha/beta fold hydrolase n=1 Tax=Isachenkonia alkalipeptolytica TaxID=2565777 RepID=A0AA43XKT5_9CLOT|nr:alpha/beta fold hydrolase [Isachenkonia alkalipeptolytica]NBG88673.1 alpha/beta fold hydrolase [Isachenkonia alkalipeptolytica]